MTKGFSPERKDSIAIEHYRGDTRLGARNLPSTRLQAIRKATLDQATQKDV